MVTHATFGGIIESKIGPGLSLFKTVTLPLLLNIFLRTRLQIVASYQSRGRYISCEVANLLPRLMNRYSVRLYKLVAS